MFFHSKNIFLFKFFLDNVQLNVKGGGHAYCCVSVLECFVQKFPYVEPKNLIPRLNFEILLKKLYHFKCPNSEPQQLELI